MRSAPHQGFPWQERAGRGEVPYAFLSQNCLRTKRRRVNRAAPLTVAKSFVDLQNPAQNQSTEPAVLQGGSPYLQSPPPGARARPEFYPCTWRATRPGE